MKKQKEWEMKHIAHKKRTDPSHANAKKNPKDSKEQKNEQKRKRIILKDKPKEQNQLETIKEEPVNGTDINNNTIIQSEKEEEKPISMLNSKITPTNTNLEKQKSDNLSISTTYLAGFVDNRERDNNLLHHLKYSQSLAKPFKLKLSKKQRKLQDNSSTIFSFISNEDKDEFIFKNKKKKNKLLAHTTVLNTITAKVEVFLILIFFRRKNRKIFLEIKRKD